MYMCELLIIISEYAALTPDLVYLLVLILTQAFWSLCYYISKNCSCSTGMFKSHVVIISVVLNFKDLIESYLQ